MEGLVKTTLMPWLESLAKFYKTNDEATLDQCELMLNSYAKHYPTSSKSTMCSAALAALHIASKKDIDLNAMIKLSSGSVDSAKVYDAISKFTPRPLGVPATPLVGAKTVDVVSKLDEAEPVAFERMTVPVEPLTPVPEPVASPVAPPDAPPDVPPVAAPVAPTPVATQVKPAIQVKARSEKRRFHPYAGSPVSKSSIRFTIRDYATRAWPSAFKEIVNKDAPDAFLGLLESLALEFLTDHTVHLVHEVHDILVAMFSTVMHVTHLADVADALLAVKGYTTLSLKPESNVSLVTDIVLKYEGKLLSLI